MEQGFDELDRVIEGSVSLQADGILWITASIDNREPIILKVETDEDKYTIQHEGIGITVTDVISARVEITTLLLDHHAITDEEVENVKDCIEHAWQSPLDSYTKINSMIEESL